MRGQECISFSYHFIYIVFHCSHYKVELIIRIEEVILPEPYVLRLISLSQCITLLMSFPNYCNTDRRDIWRDGGLFKVLSSDNMILFFNSKENI